MDDLVQFLRARLDEDYETARLPLGVNLMADLKNGKPVPRWELQSDGTIRDSGDRATPRVKGTWLREAEHIARHDPARVLADVDAKRRLVDLCAPPLVEVTDLHSTEPQYVPGEGAPWGLPVLHLLALPYADHPDYQETWKP